jgi:hypothetical protein
MNTPVFLSKAGISYLIGAAIFFTAVGLLLPAALLSEWVDRARGMRVPGSSGLGEPNNKFGTKGEMA